jgi:hypothetical protein
MSSRAQDNFQQSLSSSLHEARNISANYSYFSEENQVCLGNAFGAVMVQFPYASQDGRAVRAALPSDPLVLGQFHGRSHEKVMSRHLFSVFPAKHLHCAE